MNKRITIIVLTHNQLENSTIPFIESLYQNTNIDDFDLILIDNGSQKATIDYINSLNYKNLHPVFNSQNVGYSKGMNIGLKLYEQNYKSPYIGLLNNDILFTPNWLDNMLNAFEQNKEIGSASPRVNSFYETKHKIFTPSNYKEKHSINQDKSINYVIKPYYCCILLTRNAFLQTGYLDENFSPAFYEDDDYSLRLMYLGYKNAIINTSFVYHNHCSTSRHLAQKEELISKNKNIFYNKHSIGNFIYEISEFILLPHYSKNFYCFMKILSNILPVPGWQTNLKKICQLYKYSQKIYKSDILNIK